MNSEEWPNLEKKDLLNVMAQVFPFFLIVPLPQKSRDFLRPRCEISSAKEIASEPRFLLRRKWVRMLLAAGFLALPSSAVKITSELWCTQFGNTMGVVRPGGISGKKKEPKPKLFGPDIFGWGGGLPCEGVGAKKLGMSCETQGNQTRWRDIPGFLPGYPSVHFSSPRFRKTIVAKKSYNKTTIRRKLNFWRQLLW